MAATRTLPRKRHSRKGRVPFTFEISPELKAEVVKVAEEKGMSISEAAAIILEDFVIRQALLEQLMPYIEEAVKEEMERTFTKQITPMLEATSKNEKMYRILKRILINPADKIEAVEREIEEKAIN